MKIRLNQEHTLLQRRLYTEQGQCPILLEEYADKIDPVTMSLK